MNNEVYSAIDKANSLLAYVRETPSFYKQSGQLVSNVFGITIRPVFYICRETYAKIVDELHYYGNAINYADATLFGVKVVLVDTPHPNAPGIVLALEPSETPEKMEEV